MCKKNVIEMRATSVSSGKSRSGSGDDSSEDQGGFSVFQVHATSIVVNLIIGFVGLLCLGMLYKCCCGSRTAKSFRELARNRQVMDRLELGQQQPNFANRPAYAARE